MFVSALVLCFVSVALASNVPQYQFVEEWKLWKSQHGREYESTLEDLDRHIVWLSNKKYIELHNSNSHIFGYTLSLNHFGDMVSFA